MTKRNSELLRLEPLSKEIVTDELSNDLVEDDFSWLFEENASLFEQLTSLLEFDFSDQECVLLDGAVLPQSNETFQQTIKKQLLDRMNGKNVSHRNKAVNALTTANKGGCTPYDRLIKIGFTLRHIISVFRPKGGSNNLLALINLLTPVKDAQPNPEGRILTPLDSLIATGFTPEQVIKVLSNKGGSHNLAALITLLKPVKDAQPNPEGRILTPLDSLIATGFTPEQVIKVLGNIGGSHNLQALISLVHSCKNTLSKHSDFIRVIAIFSACPSSSHRINFIKNILVNPQLRSCLTKRPNLLENLCLKLKGKNQKTLKTITIATEEGLLAFCRENTNLPKRLNITAGRKRKAHTQPDVAPPPKITIINNMTELRTPEAGLYSALDLIPPTPPLGQDNRCQTNNPHAFFSTATPRPLIRNLEALRPPEARPCSVLENLCVAKP